MMQSHPPGFHTGLTPYKKELILSNVEGNFSLAQIARMSKIAKQTLIDWYNRGMEDIKNDRDSIFAQLSGEIDYIRGKEIKKMLTVVSTGKKNWQPRWELLRVVAKEFGADAIELKELLEKFEELNQTVIRLKDNHGGLYNGREMDSESNKETRSS